MARSTPTGPQPERQVYRLNTGQHEQLLAAARAAGAEEDPGLAMGIINSTWRSLGEELGFHWISVMPVPGMPDNVFTAVFHVAEPEPDDDPEEWDENDAEEVIDA